MKNISLINECDLAIIQIIDHPNMNADLLFDENKKEQKF
jgi:hypothetical protein